MHKFLFFVVLVLSIKTNTFAQNPRILDSEYVVFTEQIDSSLLKKQLLETEKQIKDAFVDEYKFLGADSLNKLCDNTNYYYICQYEFVKEKADTVYLKPYSDNLLKFFILLHNELLIGIQENFDNYKKYKRNIVQILFTRKVKPSQIPIKKYSGFDLYFFEHLFEKKIFAIKDYVENNYQYDFFWFYVNKQGRLEKINNTEIMF